MRAEPLPWDFEVIVLEHARNSPDLLDLGTGGGEWLASLPERPARTAATESWEPNVSVARTRLAPLGVDVVQVEAAPDNVEQARDEQSGRLPFPDSSFRLVVSRHEAYVPREVARVLAAGGRFLTEQAGVRNDDDFHVLLGLEPPAPAKPAWTLTLATAQLEDAGLEPGDSAEAAHTITFADVGALIWYLKAVPWAVPGFSPSALRYRLEELHERGPLSVRQQRFWLEAGKPYG